MSTLAAQYKAGEARVKDGQSRRPTGHDRYRSHNSPPTGFDPDKVRASFEAVVSKAKADFASGIAANLTGDEFRSICSFIPRSEEVYRIVERTYGVRPVDERIHILGPTKEVEQVIDEVWKPFLGWVQEQGLELTMAGYVNEGGRNEYYVLEVWPLDDESDDE
jgi:hypothetical protein